MDKTERMSAKDFAALPTAGRGRKSAKTVPAPLAEPVFEAAPAGKVANYSFTYSGQGLSSNKWYSGMHWTKRQKLKEEWKAKFYPLICASGILPMPALRLSLRYRSKFDADNCTAMIKLLIDQIKGWFIPDDTPKYFRGFAVEYDETLPHNTFIFTFTELL
jgi:hypothetical protein